MELETKRVYTQSVYNVGSRICSNYSLYLTLLEDGSNLIHVNFINMQILMNTQTTIRSCLVGFTLLSDN